MTIYNKINRISYPSSGTVYKVPFPVVDERDVEVRVGGNKVTNFCIIRNDVVFDSVPDEQIDIIRAIPILQETSFKSLSLQNQAIEVATDRLTMIAQDFDERLEYQEKRTAESSPRRCVRISREGPEPAEADYVLPDDRKDKILSFSETGLKVLEPAKPLVVKNDTLDIVLDEHTLKVEGGKLAGNYKTGTGLKISDGKIELTEASRVDWDSPNPMSREYILNRPFVVDDLKSTSAKSLLSANQGRVLNEKIAAAVGVKSDWTAPAGSDAEILHKPHIPEVIDRTDSTSQVDALSAKQGANLRQSISDVEFGLTDVGNTVLAHTTDIADLKTKAVQSDWNQLDPTAPDYVKNRKGIPFICDHYEGGPVTTCCLSANRGHFLNERLKVLEAKAAADEPAWNGTGVKSDWNAPSGSDAEILNKPYIPEVIDDYDSDSSVDALSANMGKGLYELYDNHQSAIVSLTGDVSNLVDDIDAIKTDLVSAQSNITTVTDSIGNLGSRVSLLESDLSDTRTNVVGMETGLSNISASLSGFSTMISANEVAIGDLASWRAIVTEDTLPVLRGDLDAIELRIAAIEGGLGIGTPGDGPCGAVQSDWGETDEMSLSYIKNKPVDMSAELAVMEMNIRALRSDMDHSDNSAVRYWMLDLFLDWEDLTTGDIENGFWKMEVPGLQVDDILVIDPQSSDFSGVEYAQCAEDNWLRFKFGDALPCSLAHIRLFVYAVKKGTCLAIRD